MKTKPTAPRFSSCQPISDLQSQHTTHLLAEKEKYDETPSAVWRGDRYQSQMRVRPPGYMIGVGYSLQSLHPSGVRKGLTRLQNSCPAIGGLARKTQSVTITLLNRYFCSKDLFSTCSVLLPLCTRLVPVLLSNVDSDSMVISRLRLPTCQ